ncbi:MAG: hypothetical protein Q4B18_07865 [Bacillota bacterium]|nr:hypothetical protein [Bacillota bacterium]
MLTNDRERKICEKYSAVGEDGRVRCRECPLVKDFAHILCKANSHYNRKRREGVYDWEEVQE